MLGKIISIEDNTVKLKLEINLEESKSIMNLYVLIEDSEKKLIDVLANALIEKETITKEEIEDLVEANSNYKVKSEETKETKKEEKEEQVKEEE